MSAGRPRVVLASSSPRRREMLEGAGFDVAVCTPSIDDALLPVRAAHVSRDCMALAWFKAAQVLAQERAAPTGALHDAVAVVAADTACVLGSSALGKPESEREARVMLEGTRLRVQQVWSGACVLSPDGSRRRMMSVCAAVQFGDVADTLIDEHIRAGRWRGKAGGYDIADLLAQGWPVTVEGDERVVRGMPLREVIGAIEGMVQGCAP